MTPEQLVRTYLGALGRADLAAMLALFTADGQVHSPLYGPMPAAGFFPELFGATTESSLTLEGVAQGTAEAGTPLVTLWFRYDWLMAAGAGPASTSWTCWNWPRTAGSPPCASSTTPCWPGRCSTSRPASRPGARAISSGLVS